MRHKVGVSAYGALALPLAFAGVPIYIHAPDYYARQGGLALGSIGVCLFLVRGIDALTDPAIGWLADRRPDWRLPSMVAGLVAMLVGFVLLFSPLGLDSLLWLGSCLVVVTLGYSILSIQLNTLGALWSRHASMQIRITSVREALGIVGLVGAAVAPTLLQRWYSEAEAYLFTGLILALLSLVALGAFGLWYRSHAALLQRVASANAQTHPASAVPWSFFTVYGLSILASAIPAVLVIFFVRDRLELQPYTGLFLAAYFLSGVVAMPIWRLVSARTGHRLGWQLAMLLGVVSFVWAFALGPGDLAQFLAVCLLSGLALGGELALPPALLSQLIHGHEAVSRASRYFAWCSFLTKLALALAAGLLLPLLQWSGFAPGAVNDEAALLALSAAYALLPSALKALALGASLFLMRSEANFHETSTFNQRSALGGVHVI